MLSENLRKSKAPKMKLLIVDDEPSILKALKEMLRPVTEDIVTMDNSQEASECVQQKPFDAMILDVHMPAPDGFELTRRARASALNAKSPIALLTGYDDVRTMQEGFKAGASCLLGKPVTREKLFSLMSFMSGPVILGKRRSTRLPYRCKVTCSPVNSGAKRFVAVSLDLAEGGMLLEPSGGLHVNEEAFLEFEVPSSERRLHMRARVVRRDSPDRIGVQFLDCPIRDFNTIQEFILQELHG